MPRVKRGVTARARHKKVYKQAKGFRGRRKNVYRVAKQAVMKAGVIGVIGVFPPQAMTAPIGVSSSRGT